MISVLFGPEKGFSSDVIVVLDVLRATSVIVTALANGALLIKPVSSIREAVKMKKEGYIIGGERSAVKLQSFDKGNSPLEYFDVAGSKIVLTTSNGTRLIKKAMKYSKNIIAGAFLNLTEIVEYIRNVENIILWCAGNKREVSYEDTLLAGAILEKLNRIGRRDFHDSALVALEFFGRRKEIKFRGTHARRLIGLGYEKDVAFCSQVDIYSVLPVLREDVFIKR
ncbi:2-phosphosulfolactate phosphatase [Thermosipho ferrireducens]|uniref:Probable 2-phosphosulfolactate phosphatase n=1 Tax=Thermosipho ferrireducens TaxID=2571116 RepID=A0ABX7S9Q4_9BACT|nr:2-phosphosulfolactate phosphatase [Thermosipho ferrireducens]QTA38615.1 2-phosphosulfolactate phosphatase [Thermosipho ferrireducens]